MTEKIKRNSNGATGKRGGRRQGAGRPQGARSRATKTHKATLSDLAREHTSVALTALVDIAKGGESESARVSAANALLDRAYGKPTQAHEHKGAIGTYDLTKLSDDEFNRLEDILGSLALDGRDQSGEGEEDGSG
ncbi:hypothetical protein A6U86_05515 [Rhizobium sp. AC27/96]|uniref:hypothetical protein n=1 Tax=Rhizobium sp. AC27/96 TaxID=1841653 RepID=UPI00082815E6|nr:hypothetical protein [Rhizobium sp. AC27/96]OCJ12480.1 hypothetical protein A6U86_05515 [Rhizobium sp. AC27/96]